MTRETSTTGAQKVTKPQRFSLVPTQALNILAEMYGEGVKKYNETPDDPNWRKGFEWSKSYDALMRHATAFWGGEDLDPESGMPHMAAVCFNAFTLLTFMSEHPEFDDRYKKAGNNDEENNSNTAQWVGEVPPSGSYGGNPAGRFPGGRLDGKA